MSLELLSQFRFNILALPIFIVSILTPLTGIFIFLQNKKSVVNFSFFLLCVSIHIWLIGNTMVYSTPDPVLALTLYRRVTFFGVVLISPMVYFFSTVWLNIYARKKVFVILGFLGAATFYGVGLFSAQSFPGVTKYFWGYYPVYGLFNYGFLAFFFAYFFAAFYNFIKAYRREDQSLRQTQIKLIAIAFLVSFLSSFDYVPKLTYFPLYPLGFLYVFSWILIVGYAIVKYKTMDIETVIHKTLLWFLSTVVTALPLAAIIHWSETQTTAWTAVARTAYYLTVFVIFYFYFRAVQPLLGHFFRRKRANLAKVVSEFSSELVHLQDLRDLLKRFVRLMQRTVYAKEVSVILRDETENQFVPVIARGARGLSKISADHPFLKWIETRDRIISADLIEGDPETQSFLEPMRDYFKSVHAWLVVPFTLGGKLIGVLHLGKKENLKRYSADEVDFLSRLKYPMTIAFSNSKQLEDISRLYKQVQSQNERLRELDRLKSEFLANTSHELRTPIHGILGLVESILDGSDGAVNEPQAKHLRMIIESGTNLKELINNLLELSRIESGQEEFDLKFFNVLNVIDAVIALTESLAKKKGLKISRVSAASVSDVYGDPAKIQRVVMNLVGNAIKFTEKGSVTVRVSEDAEQVNIRVEDTGVGIPDNKQHIIFERFRQVDGSATRNFEGTGLGLSIAKEIVQRHQDDIQVQSEPGKGSVFSFSLSKTAFSPEPLAPEKRKAADATRAIKGISETQKQFSGSGFDKEYELEKDAEYLDAIRGHDELILIIDDNEVNREVVKTRLKLNHYRVVEAVDGVEGFEKFKQVKPDLVVLDLMMPKMSGYEFCKKLRETHSIDELPVIMLTAKTEMGDKIYGLSLGANDYISKPFNKEELIARVSILLKIRQMNRELKKWNETLEQRVDERTAELVKTQQQLIQAEKMATIGTMAGGVAHEINNPLTAVLTNAQILKMSATEADLESIDLIEEGAKRCQIIVQKLMKYCRKPQEDAVHEKVNLRQVIQNVVAFLSYQFEQENIKVDLRLGEAPLIYGISNELEQVFTNLFVNARDAIRDTQKPGRISVDLGSHDGYVEVKVSDNGKGMPPEIMTKIFDPFFTTKDVGSGTGLGLSISYGIVQRHNGKIHVKSNEGEGSTFIVRLPMFIDELADTTK